MQPADSNHFISRLIIDNHLRNFAYNAGNLRPVMLMNCVNVCTTTSGTRKALNGIAANALDSFLKAVCTVFVQQLLADVDAVLRSSSANKSLIKYQVPSTTISSIVMNTPIVILSAVPLHALQL
eukprot:763-Heterococcus_DN1.PRE.1